LEVADAKKLPYEKKIDVVIDCATIQHTTFKDHIRAYDEISRVLMPRGYFWSFHIAKDSWGYGTGNLIDHKTFENLSEGPLEKILGRFVCLMMTI